MDEIWQKVDAGGGAYKLIKRNATGFALDGGSNGSNGQNVNLYDSSNSSQNLQWFITPTDATKAPELVSDQEIVMYPNPVINNLTIQGTSDANVTIYDINGKKVTIGNYDNGMKTGKWIFWSGDKLREVDFKESRITSVSEWTDKVQVAVNNK